MDTYKGNPYPQTDLDNGIWYIADEEAGWFSGPTERHVLELWKLKVDRQLVVESISSGFISELTEGSYACLKCGSPVLDIYTHKKFHEDLTRDR